ncbi:high mobility group box domain-containing protein, partial [Mycena haematopus]
GHIRRPRNAFICFRSTYVKRQKSLTAQPGSLNQTDMSRGAAEVWRGMSAEERAPYILMAQEEKEEHTRKYPNYRYAP